MAPTVGVLLYIEKYIFAISLFLVEIKISLRHDLSAGAALAVGAACQVVDGAVRTIDGAIKKRILWISKTCGTIRPRD
jgi:hypothetical protein